ncbi:hypothetical protein FOL47_009033 [Perkinsus chesapeaki]|uniref:Uncharacterized protein n=1 Tax=Perkinsus chesapeaki TaxID=330153 RepID=A0A7J6LAZ9_PERCH|nr:hypothetical protein FOL47_009033 [Perkinsus chesapeaki]
MTGKYDLGDYEVPKHGLAGKVKGGALPKDSGQVTSRIGQIKKLAGSTPGPGKYIKHAPWPQYPPGEEFSHGSKGYKFDKGSRDKGGIIKTDKGSATPAPGKYDITKVDLVKPRCLGGPMSKKAKKSFLDKAIKFGATIPAPNKALGKNPGPGQYKSIALEKISRGTKWNQVHGYSRNALHGAF